MKIAAEKNKTKKLSTNKGVDKWQRLNLPPKIIQLLRSKRRTKRSPLHNVSITCVTKWWVPPTIRCSRTRYPEFRHLCNSSNISSASTPQVHFHGDYIIHNAAMDCRQIMSYSSKERAWVGYDCDPFDPFDKKSAEMVDHVEVFRLCFDELKWIKMERLQGKTVFLDRPCWVNSAEIGCRGDCVYFTQGEDNVWWIYDMKNSCISVAENDSDFPLHEEC